MISVGVALLEALHPRALARRPEAHVDERADPVAVGAVDAARAQIFEHVRGAELRHPRIVEQIHVVLAGAALRVGEPLLQRHAVFVFQELDVEAGVGLRERDDLVLERRQAAVGKGADDDLAARGLRRRARRAPPQRRRLLFPATAFDGLSATRNHASLSFQLSLAWRAMHDGRTRRVEEARVPRIECRADGRADGGGESPRRAHCDPFACRPED